MISAELRWFWKYSLPDPIERWFRSREFAPVGGVSRVDEYLVNPAQPELGVKKRGGGYGVEIKGLVALGRQTNRAAGGRAQVWSKWLSEALTIDQLPRINVKKTRWIRKFSTSGSQVTEVRLDLPQSRTALDRIAQGCFFELVALAIEDGPTTWWTVAFEAFGDLATVEDSLQRTFEHVASPAQLASGLAMSYPEWLARFIVEDTP